MSWEIFLGIVALVGFCVTIATPLMKLSKTMTELNVNMQNLNQAMNTLTANNTESHRRIWAHNEEQDEKLENHEKRITKIETKMDIIHPEHQ